MGVLLLIIAIFFNAAGNIFLKLSADHGFMLSLEHGVWPVVVENRLFIAGAFLFAVNIFFYAAALRALPLSVAYPVMIGAVFLLVGAYAALALHESLTPIHIVGYVLIVGGIILVSMTQPA